MQPLGLIKHAQRLGFTLAEIAELSTPHRDVVSCSVWPLMARSCRASVRAATQDPPEGHAALRGQVTAHPASTRAEQWTQWQQDQALTVTSTPSKLTRPRARAPRGQRARSRIPRGRWATITLLATMTLEGMGPAVQFPAALDRDVFDTFVEEWLVPTLYPGQVIRWDNLQVQRSARARRAIEAAGGQRLPTPRSSPDGNPIEHAFSTLTTALRRTEARTFASIITAIGDAFATTAPADARSSFAAAGYPVVGQSLGNVL